MTRNQEIFKNNEQNANRYPSVKVIVSFVLFGGAIGSIVLSAYILITNIIDGAYWLDVEFFC